MSLSEAAASGDRRAALTALRDTLAVTLERADDRIVAALAKQLADVLRELDALPVGREESKLDELAKRRADRLAGPDVQVGA